MKKSLIAILVCASVNGATAAEYATPGNHSLFTLSDLVLNPSVMIENEDKVFSLRCNLTISPTDTLLIAGDETLYVDTDNSVTIQGYAKFIGNGSTTIGSLNEEAPARSILIDEGCGVFDGIVFDNIGLYSWTTEGISVTGCTFKHVTTASSSQAALAFGCSSTNNKVTGCIFTDNRVPGVGSAANAFCGITLEDCSFKDCNSDNTNMPMINLTTPAENGPTVIRGNVIEGAKRNMVGGISVANMVGGEMGDVVIEGNEVRDCRYGINIFGPMNAQVRNNYLYDNRYESNPMNGGSAISCTAFSGLQNTIISGNHIEGSLWGVTLISYGFLMPGYYQGFSLVSLGRPGDETIDSPGDNVFFANGNDGSVYDASHPYDLYNNTDQTVYAQHNTWSVAEQTQEEIEKVIYDKTDDAALGEVIFTDDTQGVKSVSDYADGLRYDAKSETLIYDGISDIIEVYDLHGRKIASMYATSMLSVSDLPNGVYVANAKRGIDMVGIKFVK